MREGGTENILSAVLRRGDDSMNTTIFLELILVIVGETGIPDRIQTYNLEDRSLLLCSVELRKYMVPQ